jgi:hypothetical protein
MDFCIAAVGIASSGLSLVTILNAIGLQSFIYLTIWTLIIHLSLFMSLLGGFMKSHLFKVLIIISWTLGWQVTIVYWVYVFPLLTEKNRLPLPPWFDFLAHGGVHFLVVLIFLRFKGSFTTQDFVYPLSVALGYLFLVVTPLRFLGVIVYPKFFEEVIPTISVIIGSIVVSLFCFYAGKVVKDRKMVKVE